MLIVQKYGGTSLADTACIFRAAERAAALSRQGNRLVIVVSAQGDTTDALVSAADAIAPHADPRELDALLSAGEQMSAALTAMALQSLGCRAVSLTGWQAGIHTDTRHTDALITEIDAQRIRSELNDGTIAVVSGFQGISPEGNITTLGRGGSDTTAAALAGVLQADLCQIYTDVDGVYDLDPRRYPEAKRFDRISYGQMLDLIDKGAQVLHRRSVETAMQYHMALEVLSSFTGRQGTFVG